MPVRVVLYADAQKLEQELATARQENERLQGELRLVELDGGYQLGTRDSKAAIARLERRYEQLVAAARKTIAEWRADAALGRKTGKAPYGWSIGVEMCAARLDRLLPPVTGEKGVDRS